MLDVLTGGNFGREKGLKREPQIKTAAPPVKYAINACESACFGFDGGACDEYVKRS
jgi:hypothetical protein